jgi:hypothetical protein
LGLITEALNDKAADVVGVIDAARKFAILAKVVDTDLKSVCGTTIAYQ